MAKKKKKTKEYEPMSMDAWRKLHPKKKRSRKKKRAKRKYLTPEILAAKYKKDGYSSEWTAELRAKIRKRDLNRCCLCLKTNKQEVAEGKFMALPVHHIDHDKANCLPTNLITVCSECHGEIHSEFCPVSRKALEYMASTRT